MDKKKVFIDIIDVEGTHEKLAELMKEFNVEGTHPLGICIIGGHPPSLTRALILDSLGAIAAVNDSEQICWIDDLEDIQPVRLQCSNIMRGLDLKYFGEDPEAWDMPTGKDKVLLGVGKTYHQFVQPRINGKKKKR